MLLRKLAEKELRPKRERSYPREKKAARQKWPLKRVGKPPPGQPSKPFAQAVYMITPLPKEEGEQTRKTSKRRKETVFNGH